MKFAHIADCHLGGWRETKLRDINHEAFERVIDEITEEKVDFVLISGDLFNTSFPPIDSLKLVIQKFKQLKRNNIRVYYIAGSHDYSPSGKTMLDVIEEAGLGKNVVRGDVEDNKLKLKFTEDETGAKITGILGKRGMLDRKYYESLDRENIEKEEGFKIFMFHTAINELKENDKIEGSPISLLPKGFDYYAGGHVHIIRQENIEGYNNVVYPGPVFPNNFSELEELEKGSYYIYEEGNIRRKDVMPVDYKKIVVDCNNRTPEEVTNDIKDRMQDIKDKLVTIRVKGKLAGKITDIDFKDIFTDDAYFIMKNTTQIQTENIEDIKVRSDSVEEIEDKVINEHIGQISNPFDDEKEMTKELIGLLSKDKDEGETKPDYEERIKREIDKTLEQK